MCTSISSIISYYRTVHQFVQGQKKVGLFVPMKNSSFDYQLTLMLLSNPAIFLPTRESYDSISYQFGPKQEATFWLLLSNEVEGDAALVHQHLEAGQNHS